jgi:hypothetical protein
MKVCAVISNSRENIPMTEEERSLRDAMVSVVAFFSGRYNDHRKNKGMPIAVAVAMIRKSIREQ